jgi:hypothetical protein
VTGFAEGEVDQGRPVCPLGVLRYHRAAGELDVCRVRAERQDIAS